MPPASPAAEFARLGIGRHPPEPSGRVVADYVLGLMKDDGRHCWGMFGSCTLMGRTETFRGFGGFDQRFRRCAELDLAVRAALGGAHFISVDAPLVTQHLTPSATKTGPISSIAFYCSKSTSLPEAEEGVCWRTVLHACAVLPVVGDGDGDCGI